MELYAINDGDFVVIFDGCPKQNRRGAWVDTLFPDDGVVRTEKVCHKMAEISLSLFKNPPTEDAPPVRVIGLCFDSERSQMTFEQWAEAERLDELAYDYRWHTACEHAWNASRSALGPQP